MDKILKLSLNDIDIIKEQTDEDGSIDFALARLKFIGTSLDDSENSQGYLLNEYTLKTYANTALGKLITGKINPYSKDLMSHEEDNSVFGYVPPNSKIEFIEENGRWFAVCEAVISKIYCKEVIDAFKYDNERCVSIEASFESNPNNPKEIIKFHIHSITILAKFIRGAVKGANMEIIKFSSEKAEEYYNQYSENPIKKFAEDRKKKMAKNKDIKSEKKLDLYKEESGKEEKMVNTEKETDEKKVELAEDNKDIIMGSDEEKEEEQAKMAEQDTEPEKKLDTVEETQDDKNSKEENKAKWSMDEVGALLSDSKVKDVVLAMFAECSLECLVSKVAELAEVKDELEKDKEKNDKEKANVKFSQIMAMAKMKLEDAKYDEIYKKGEALKFSELESFERDVKACICDTIVFSESADSNPTISFGTHLKHAETKNNGLWD